MRVAAIDCGTNSIRLLIAEVMRDSSGVRLQPLEREMRIVRLGEGVDATGMFAEAALNRTFAAAREYADLIAQYGVEKVRFGATSATRDAQNRQIFIEGIQQILGVVPEVISGTEEAQLSFAGAVSAVGRAKEPTLVVDLGGGSTEFVVGDQNSVVAAVSMDIGCVRLTERHEVSAPVTQQQRLSIIDDVERALDAAARTVDFSTVARLVGVAGTVTTVVAHALNLPAYAPERINGTELSVAEIRAAADDLAGMSAQQRGHLGFMHEGRIDVIGAGAIIWATIVERIASASSGAVNSAVASEFDILDGLALSLVS